jgi:iron-sulfur cluster insertion protein
MTDVSENEISDNKVANSSSAAPQVGLSDSALTKVRQLLAEEENQALKLRVFISGGGCSGFSYGFTFDDEMADDDAVFERDGVTLLVDALSYEYLLGSQADYKEDLSGAQFVVNNPNAASTCGCGNSFSI